MLKNRRLEIIPEETMDNSFVVGNSEITFAKVYKVGSKWHCWYCKRHLMKDFEKLKEAFADVNEQWGKFLAIH